MNTYALSNHKYVILASGPNALILPCTHAHTHACATHTHTVMKEKGMDEGQMKEDLMGRQRWKDH